MLKTDMSITGVIIVLCLTLLWLDVISILFAIFIILSWISIILVQFRDFYAQEKGKFKI
jgi:hypothetical protein